MAKYNLGFDIGHGGKDSGAVKGKRRECDDVLKLGTAVMNYVEKETNNEVMCYRSRTKDTTLSLEERSNWANKKGYNLFISFHRDSTKTAPRGASVRTYLNQKGKPARKLADSIANKLCPILPGRADWVCENDFSVLRRTSMPAVLIECGFISNTEDNKIFDTKFNEIVKAIGDGIIAHLGVKTVKYQERYSVSISGMTDKSRQKLITDFLDKNKFNYKAESYNVKI